MSDQILTHAKHFSPYAQHCTQPYLSIHDLPQWHCVCIIICIYLKVWLTFPGGIRAPTLGNTVAPPNLTSLICESTKHIKCWKITSHESFEVVEQYCHLSG